MEGCCFTFGHQLIGGIALDPAAVQGKDPKSSSAGNGALRRLPEAEAEQQQTGVELNVDTLLGKSASLPLQPALETSDTGARGRPKKSLGSESPSVPVAKRGRGRPKKTPSASPGGLDGRESAVGMIRPAHAANPVFTDPDYQPSCIDNLVEDMLMSKPSAQRKQTPIAITGQKRPVGRPRKRPRSASKPVKPVGVLERLCVSSSENMPLGSGPTATWMHITKDMVDKMTEKGGQVRD